MVLCKVTAQSDQYTFKPFPNNGLPEDWSILDKKDGPGMWDRELMLKVWALGVFGTLMILLGPVFSTPVLVLDSVPTPNEKLYVNCLLYLGLLLSQGHPQDVWNHCLPESMWSILSRLYPSELSKVGCHHEGAAGPHSITKGQLALVVNSCVPNASHPRFKFPR